VVWNFIVDANLFESDIDQLILNCFRQIFAFIQLTMVSDMSPAKILPFLVWSANEIVNNPVPAPIHCR